MGASVKPAVNPFFREFDDLLMEVPNKKYRCEIFCLTIDDRNGDGEIFQDLMNRINHPDSNLLPFGGQYVTKSWTKTGDLMAFVEYYEMEEKEAETPDSMQY